MKCIQAILIALILFASACTQQVSTEEYMENGRSYFNERKWKSAVIEFKNVLQQSPKHSEARALLGQTYIKTGSSNAAIKELKRAIEFGYDKDILMRPLSKAYLQVDQLHNVVDEILPNKNQSKETQASIYAMRAIAYMGLKNEKQSLSSLNKAKKIDESNTEVRLAWAFFEKNKGDLTAQKKWLKPILSSEVGVADAWTQWAEIELKEKNLTEAINAYSRSIELRSYPHLDSLRRALIYLDMDKLDQAQQDIDGLKKAGANWYMINHVAGVIALKKQQWDQAQTLFQKTLSMNPDYAPSQYLLAIIEEKKSNLQKALTLLEQYTDKIPDQKSANILYVKVLLKLNKPEKAKLLLEKIYQDHKGDLQVLTLLGKTYLQQGKNSQAIEFFNQSLAIQPDNPSIRFLLGKAMIGQPLTASKGRQEIIDLIKIEPKFVQAEIELYNSYINEKKFDDARKVSTEITNKYPKLSLGDLLFSLSYLNQGEKEKTEELLLKAIKKYPADEALSRYLAKIYMQNQKTSDAKGLYQVLLDKNPKNLAVLKQMAVISKVEGNQEQVIAWLKKAKDRNPDRLEPTLMLAAEYLGMKKTDKAVKLLELEKKNNQDNFQLRLLMAQSKIAMGLLEQAALILNPLALEYPEMIAPYFLLARIYATENKLVKFRNSLEKVLKLDPNHFEGNIALARLEMVEGNKNALEERVQWLYQRFPEQPEVLDLKAKLESVNRNYPEAIKTLTKLKSQVKSAGVVIGLSRSYWKSGQHEEAINNLEAWNRDNPEDLNVLLDLGQFYSYVGREKEALSVYKKLYKLKPRDINVLNNLAWLLKDDNPAQGIKYAEEALLYAESDPEIMDTLALLYYKNNESEKAEAYSRSAVRIKPENEDFQLNHAKILIANKKVKQAQKILGQLIEKTKSLDTKQAVAAELNKLNQ